LGTNIDRNEAVAGASRDVAERHKMTVCIRSAVPGPVADICPTPVDVRKATHGGRP
jgi:hypothetical protein